MKTRKHLWFGEWIDETQLLDKLSLLKKGDGVAQTDGPWPELWECLDRLGQSWQKKEGSYQHFLNKLNSIRVNASENEKSLMMVGEFLRYENLRQKIKRELGDEDFFHLKRQDFKSSHFEAYRPLGVLAHVAPSNDPFVGILSVIEGLMVGNVNILKVGRGDQGLALDFFHELIKGDPTRNLAQRVAVCQISSQEKSTLKSLLDGCDGVAIWGGSGAVAGIKELASAQLKIIEWGPKISLAYVTREFLSHEQTYLNIAHECRISEQLACSAPQCVYIETSDPKELERAAQNLAQALDLLSQTNVEDRPSVTPGIQEWAEITTVTQLCRLEENLGLGRVWQGEDQSWRVLMSFDPTLKASPLFRTLWLKPLPESQIISVLRKEASYLQTIGLKTTKERLATLSQVFFRAGALRITEVGKMQESYSGEPHDGQYALTRYTKRVSLVQDELLLEYADLRELAPQEEKKRRQEAVPLLSKENFQKQKIEDRYAELFFRSGGSSGRPALSLFTYEDYHRQMQAAATGLLAAGLDPRQDLSMNLFYGGGLYGGFLSFFTILEHLQARQLPMAAYEDLDLVAQAIVDHKVNVLLGMPSYLWRLFMEKGPILKAARVEKIFYGGEPFSVTQKTYLAENFGIKIVRSASYGSVDAGPLGYQCSYSEGGVHHLQESLQELEILEQESDTWVNGEEVGRLVFTSKVRTGQKLERYEIGDLGRWVKGACLCGRTSPRFELLGRHGDIFRASGSFFNFNKFAKHLAQEAHYPGEVQVLIQKDQQGLDQIVVVLNQEFATNIEKAREILLKEMPELKEVVYKEKTLGLELRNVPSLQFYRTTSSGKLKRVIDLRGSV